jgi:hypothetical protein
MPVVEFNKPVEYNGAEITALVLDLESMSGDDLIELENGYRTLNKGKYIPVPDIEKGYQIMVAAFSLKVNPSVLRKLPAGDFNKICEAVRDFLLG